MKKIFIPIIAAALLLSAGAAFAEKPVFNDTDASSGNIYKSDIEYWASQGVVEGDGYGNFEPLRQPTAAEFVKMLVLASGKTEVPGAPVPRFSDVSESDWFYPYVKTAYQNKIIFGNGDGTFGPEEKMSFQRADKMCTRAFMKPPIMADVIDDFSRSAAARLLTLFENSAETLIRVDGGAEASEPRYGVYKTVAEALDAAPVVSDEEHRVVISVTPGTYRERLVIDKPFITLTRDELSSGGVKLTFYYGASRNYKSYDALTEDMEYPSREDLGSDEEYAAAVKDYENKKTLLDGRPYVKSDGYVSGVGTQNSASVTVTENAHDFTAEHITFENSYNLYRTEEENGDIYEPESEADLSLTENLDEKKRNEAWYKSAEARRRDVTVSENKDAQTQAVALRCSADRSYFIGCEFIGRQDTLYIKDKARMFFTDSYAEGTVDFIFGDANAVFNHCRIHSAAYPNGGYVTAGSHSAKQNRGYLFFCCRLTGDESLNALENSKKVKLGRPWKPDALVVYYKCYMGGHIAAGEDRFADMSGNSRENARFAEISSRDADGSYLSGDVYADYEYTDDARYKFARFRDYLDAPFDKEKDEPGEPDGWDCGRGVTYDYFDDGEMIDGRPVWYDDENLYVIPETFNKK